jgi:hypothetical protein
MGRGGHELLDEEVELLPRLSYSISERQNMHLRNSVSVWRELRKIIRYAENVTKLFPM